MLPVLLARHHNILAIGEGATYRFKGFPPHDDGMSRRRFLKMSQVFWQMPRELIANPDAVFGIGGNDNSELSHDLFRPRLGL